MILTETIFQNRQPIGRIFSDTNTGLFAFSPTSGHSPLPDREWRDVDELKRAIFEAYGRAENEKP
jgi:hypothetical protein